MVYAPVELRIQRAMYRDGASEEQVRARIAAQMDDEEKRRQADFTVVNDGVQLLIPQLNRIVEQLKPKIHTINLGVSLVNCTFASSNHKYKIE